MPFLVLCFSDWDRGCRCLVRVHGQLTVAGCWVVKLVGSESLRLLIWIGNFGSARELV